MGDPGPFFLGTALMVLVVTPLVAGVARFWLRLGRWVVRCCVWALELVLRGVVAVAGFVWLVWVEVRAGMNGERRAH